MINHFKYLLLIIFSSFSFGGVFFSESAEGSGSNKYLEIYNGTEDIIDLSSYSISSCNNGCDIEDQFDYPDNITFENGTTLLPSDVFVICNPNSNSEIIEECDQTFQFLSNGDDFFALTQVGATASNYFIFDKIGDFGPDIGSGWDVAGQYAATKDHTLVRKSIVSQGNTDWNLSAGTNSIDSEWIVGEPATNDYTPLSLGSHVFDDQIYTIHVSLNGSDENGDGSEANPYASIQKGSDEADNGDTVLVGPGVYEEQIRLSNEIFLVSQNGPDETIINGTCPYNSCTVISSNESLSLKINGFTIKGGKAYDDSIDGPGWVGGAIGIVYDGWNVDSLILENMIFIDNEKFDINYGWNDIYLEIKNSTFIKNEGNIFHGSGGDEFDHIISSSIFFSEQVNMQNDYVNNFINCLTYGGVSFPNLDASNSNLINVNPLFCDPDNGDFSLAANSPAISNGENNTNIGALGVGCEVIGNTIYVSNVGSDDTGDGTEANPYASIQKAYNNIINGDTIFIFEGLYSEELILESDVSGISNFTIIGENRNDTRVSSLEFNTYGDGSNSGLHLENLSFIGNLIAKNLKYCNFINIHCESGLEVDLNGSDSLEFVLNNSVVNGSTTIENQSNSFLVSQIDQTTIVGSGYFYGGDFIISNSILWNFGTEGSTRFPKFFRNLPSTPCEQMLNEWDNTTYTFNLSIISGYKVGEGYSNEYPLFCSPFNGDFSLASNSPAINMNQDGSIVGGLGIGCELKNNGPTWYVSIDGSDHTGDGSFQNPFRTINKALNFGNDISNYNCTGKSNVDTVLIGDGIYNEPEMLFAMLPFCWYGNNDPYAENPPEECSILNDYSDYKVVIKSINGPENTKINGSQYSSNVVTILDSLHLEQFDFGVESDPVVPDLKFVIENSVLVNNSLNGPNGVIDYQIEFFNSTLINNDFSQTQLGYPVSLVGRIENSISFYNLGLNNLESINTLVDVDPLFCDPENSNYYLAANSPAIGAGINGTDIGALGVGCQEGIELAIYENVIPKFFSLHQNYPNPFNPTTTISYDLPKASVVSLSIYDLMGREIRTLINSELSAGVKILQWNATDNLGKSVPAGMYIYTIQAGEFRQTRKMVLLK